MPLTNFPNGITSFGMPVIGNGGKLIPPSSGTYYFVSSATGSDGNTGKDIAKPLATLDAAYNKCVANKSDVIVVLENHAESLASAIALDTEGVSIVGLGNGDDRPTFTLTGTAAAFTITGDNNLIDNVRIIGGIDNIVSAVNMKADYGKVQNCLFKYSSTYDTLIWVTVGETTALNATITTGNEIIGNQMVARDAAGAVKAIYIHGGQVDLNISGNTILGYYSEAVIADVNTTGDTGISVQMRIVGNFMQNGDSTDASNILDLNAASTGIMVGNHAMCKGVPVVVAHDTGALLCSQNYASNLVDAYSVAISVTASTT